jgi:MFS family permease
MNSFKRNVPLLAISQALMMSSMSLIITTVGLVGTILATDKSLATLPLGILFFAVMLTSIPAAMLMKRVGRKAGFMFATLFGITGGSLATYAIIGHHFWLFVASTAFVGMFNGFGNYFRFTAADAVEKDKKSRAISYVLLGGVVAAVVGPNLANYSYDTIPEHAFAGSYASIIAIYVLIFLTLSFLKLPNTKQTIQQESDLEVRSLRVIASQPKFIIGIICGMLGYGIMSFVMTATPIAMHHNLHSFSDTAFVIQWHTLGMFAPSFFTGHLIKRFGIYNVLLTGALFGIACVVTNLAGNTVTHYWAALLFLGLSWNFLFIGATTLITETYHAAERSKTQAMNDFIIFTTVAISSLSAGALHHKLGWQMVNVGVLPLLLIVLASILWGVLKHR